MAKKWCIIKSQSPSRSTTGIEVLDDDGGGVRRGTPKRENVTARSQVRDDGRRRIARVG
jgi:hypothetical protein